MALRAPVAVAGPSARGVAPRVSSVGSAMAGNVVPLRRALRCARRGERLAAGSVVAVAATEGRQTTKNPPFPFSKIVGQEDMKLALLLNVVDPNIGGVLIMGDRGTAKSVAVRALQNLLPDLNIVRDDPFNSDPDDVKLMGPYTLDALKNGETLDRTTMKTPLVELPLGATEDRICGTIDIEKALTEGKKAFEPGLLARANRGILYVDEVNLLDDGLVDVVLDSAASGRNTVEREGISINHPAKFIMIGSGNPAEGELRPQLLDRFGLSVSVGTLIQSDDRTELVLNRMAYEEDPVAFSIESDAGEQELRDQIMAARERLARGIDISRDIKLKISTVCSELDLDGLRGDIVVNRAAKALVAWEGRTKVEIKDVGRVLPLVTAHRMRKDVLDDIGQVEKVFYVWQRIMNPAAARKADAEKAAEEEKAKADKASNKPAGSWGGLP